MTDVEAIELKALANAALRLASDSMDFLQSLDCSTGSDPSYLDAAWDASNCIAADAFDQAAFTLQKRARKMAAVLLIVSAKGIK